MQLVSAILFLIVIILVLVVSTRKTNIPKKDLAESKKTAERILVISKYGNFIENHKILPSIIEDVLVLPYDKEKILSAILVEIACGNIIDAEALKIGAILLAQFQSNVGPTPINMFSIDFTEIDQSLSTKDQMNIIAGAKESKRFKELNILVQKDLERIESYLIVAEATRKAMPEDKRKAIYNQ